MSYLMILYVHLRFRRRNKMKIKGRYTPWEGNDVTFSNEELEKAARTFIGKPVKLMFNETIGVITDAEYNDGGIDYVAEISDLRASLRYYGIDDKKLINGLYFECLSIIVEEQGKW